MALSPLQQQRALAEFFKAEVQNLETASAAVMKQAAATLQADIRKQLRQNFKHRQGSSESKGFQRGVKVYNLPQTGTLGPASYVRLGKMPTIFTEPRQLQGKPNLVILLPEGEKLGFKRISKGNPWQAMWAKWGKFLQLAKVGDGVVVLYRFQGKLTPVYKIQPAVTTPKRIEFYSVAERIGEGLDEEIKKLLDQNV